MYIFREGDVITFDKNDKVVALYPGFQFKGAHYVCVIKVNREETELMGSEFFMRIFYEGNDIEMENVTDPALSCVLKRYVYKVNEYKL